MLKSAMSLAMPLGTALAVLAGCVSEPVTRADVSAIAPLDTAWYVTEGEGCQHLVKTW